MRKVVWLVPSHENKWVLENAVFILCAQISAFKLIFAQYGTALSVHQCMSKHAGYLNNWKPQLGNNASIDKVVLATEFPLCSKYGQPFQSPNGFRIVLFERDPSQKKKKSKRTVSGFPLSFIIVAVRTRLVLSLSACLLRQTYDDVTLQWGRDIRIGLWTG